MPATRTPTGFAVHCPECGDGEATVKMDLNHLGQCECSSCSAEFSVEDAVEQAAAALARWEAVARWVALAAEVLPQA